VDPDDARSLDAVAEASRDDTVADLIRRLVAGETANAEASLLEEFVDRLQQLTGPAMAKGLEDTAHYAYVPLASRNEVGGAPDRPLEGVVDRFHRVNCDFAKHRPGSLITTATHDTKRSGDVRSRITALSEWPDEWQRSFGRWRRLNRKYRQVVRGRIAPDPNAEWLLYQTLIGIWPAPRQGRRAGDIPDRGWRDGALERLKTYMIKAAREAKLKTSWTDPDSGYEDALLAFVSSIVTAGDDDPFLSDVSRLVSVLAPAASWNSLSRLLLHLTMPGVPDLYQGDELWNFTLVDPDNRRPVDYAARRTALDAVKSLPAVISADALVAHPHAKMIVAYRTLAFRREHPHLFAGGYRSLPAPEAVVAFERMSGDQKCVVVAPRLTKSVSGPGLELPGDLRCVITGRTASEVGQATFGLFA
jgi:(1->4)-alpha-D-glucan 1-alpha-D-glucosylmutase